MSARRVLAVLGALLVLVGVPLVVVALAGDDDGSPQQAPPAAQTVPIGEPDAGDPGAGRSAAAKQRGKGKSAGKGGDRDEKPISDEIKREYPASGNVAYPADVTEDGAYAANTVEATLGGKASKADQLTVVGADCKAGACSVRYVSGPHGGGRIASDAADILSRLFARKEVRTVTLYVHEPHGIRSDEVEPMALLSATCDRSDHPRFRWERMGAGDLDARCKVTERSPGKLGSQIRRDQLTEKDASVGREGDAPARGSGKKRKAPSKVKGSYQAQNPGEGRGSDREPDIAPEKDPPKR